MKTRMILVFSVFGLAVALAGCGSDDAEVQVSPAEIRSVPTAKITISSIEDYYEATGTVQALTTTNISANIMGRILSLPFSEGDNVSRGQVLVEIDSSASRAQLQKAEAGLQEAQSAVAEIEASVEGANAAVRAAEANKQLAEATLGRIRELFNRRSATAQEFDEAQSKYRAAVAELERANSNIKTINSKRKQVTARMAQARADIAAARISEGYSRVTAPVSGVIVKKFAEEGSTATPGAPILAIEDNSQYVLVAAVEESRTNSIRVGNRVLLRVDALGTDIIGSVVEILPAADAASRTYSVKVAIPAQPGLRSGMFGIARFPIASKEAISVPATAVVDRGQLTGVFVVGNDGVASFRIVNTGSRSEGMVEILSGLSPGDEIVTSDAATLTDGIRVR